MNHMVTAENPIPEQRLDLHIQVNLIEIHQNLNQ